MPHSAAPDSIGIIGYGNQGRPHALNLRDSGRDVVVGLREGSPSAERARADGLTVVPVAEAAGRDVVALLLPDERMGEVWAEYVAPVVRDGQLLMFAHGFAIHFGSISPPVGMDVALVSPKGAGKWVRALYEAGSGLPALVAVHQDATGRAMARAMHYAEGIGATRVGTRETTFRAETITDLFGEQAVLCGGIPALIQAGYETLTEAGYEPEDAYLECVYEAKLIVDLMLAQGLAGMRKAISPTAAYGGQRAFHRLVNAETKAEMRRLLQEIESGEFAREWVAAAPAGVPVPPGSEPIDAAQQSLMNEWPAWQPTGAPTSAPRP